MKKFYQKAQALALGSTCLLMAATASAQTKPIKIIQNADTLISANRTFSCDSVYFLRGKVYVTNGATLTINPGTVITGDTITKGTLIITKGSKIQAVGTPACPIIFTSSKGLGAKNRGDWGGLIILGKAAINPPGGLANIEGLPKGPLTEYGGGTNPDNGDNSGTLKYVRVEFAGVALSPNNEINGITFGGVGSGTVVDRVMVSYANDDSFEWFGGTVNCTHLIAFRGLDDDFDTDFGFSGHIQFGIALRDPNVADVSGSNSFESDNDAGSSTNIPQTSAVFSNITSSAGGNTTNNVNYKNGMLIRRNSHQYVYNSILLGWPTGATIDGSTTQSNVLADTMIQNNIVTGNSASTIGVTTPSNSAVITLLSNPAVKNRGAFNGNTYVKLTSPYSLTNPNFRPKTGSPALTGAGFNHVGITSFFTPTTFVGAVGPDEASDWSKEEWVDWNPNNNNYFALCDCGSGKHVRVSEVSTEAAFSIAPNPSNNGNFSINNLKNLSGNTIITVKGFSGNVIYSVKQVVTNGSSVRVNIPNAKAGVYFVTVSNGTATATEKLNITE